MKKVEQTDKKTYDFRKVMVEVRFDEYEEMDISKPVGNAIHQNTGDIGIDEIARTIYKEGKVELTRYEANLITGIVMNSQSNLVAFVKTSVRDFLTPKE